MATATTIVFLRSCQLRRLGPLLVVEQKHTDVDSGDVTYSATLVAHYSMVVLRQQRAPGLEGPRVVVSVASGGMGGVTAHAYVLEGTFEEAIQLMRDAACHREKP